MTRSTDVSTFDRRRNLLALSALIFLAAYLLGCILVFRDFHSRALTSTEPVTMKQAKNVDAHPLFHSGEVCRQLAEKLPYYAHDPAVVEHLFHLSMVKNPADYQPFLGYAD